MAAGKVHFIRDSAHGGQAVSYAFKFRRKWGDFLRGCRSSAPIDKGTGRAMLTRVHVGETKIAAHVGRDFREKRDHFAACAIGPENGFRFRGFHGGGAIRAFFFGDISGGNPNDALPVGTGILQFIIIPCAMFGQLGADSVRRASLRPFVYDAAFPVRNGRPGVSRLGNVLHGLAREAEFKAIE